MAPSEERATRPPSTPAAGPRRPRAGSIFLLLSTKAGGRIGHRYGAEPITPARLVVVPGGEPFEVSYPTAARVPFGALGGVLPDVVDVDVDRGEPGVVGVVDPVQATPFRTKLDGWVLVAPDCPLNPNESVSADRPGRFGQQAPDARSTAASGC